MKISPYFGLLLLGLLFVLSCDTTEPDTTSPEVTITFPIDNSTVSEVVVITCISTDNEGVDKVELWVDGVSTGIIDEFEPYSFNWNTTSFENGSSHSISIRSYDTSENVKDSEPISLIVDNTESYPQSVYITSIEFIDDSFHIGWNQSTDGDFYSYGLEKSIESLMNNSEIVFTSTSVSDTSFIDTDIDPLLFQYYRIIVSDTLDYVTKGDIYSSSLDPIPNSVNITSVNYTLTEMSVIWEESLDGDFRDYTLLYSESEIGEKVILETYSDKSNLSYIFTDFNPTTQNWFWIVVSDTLGQTSIGNGMTNEIDSSPSQVNITSVNYDLENMIITWEESIENDYESYELLKSDSENGNYESVVILNDISTTSYSITEYDPTTQNWFKIRVTDYWGLTSISDGMTNEIDSSPIPSSINQIEYEDGSFNISWSKNMDDDFKSYTLYESDIETMENSNIIFNSESRSDTSYIHTIGTEEIKYYQLVTKDYWDLNTQSEIVLGNSWNIFVKSLLGSNGKSVKQTSDGGYIIVGSRVTSLSGYRDIFLMKVNSNGVVEWDKTFGDELSESGYSIQITDDGGYVILGFKQSYGGWLIRTDEYGNELWSQTFENFSGDSSIEITDDGGYVIIGFSSYNLGTYQVSLIKTDVNGIQDWNSTFSIGETSRGHSVKQTDDGGYVITGYTESFGEGLNTFLIKTDTNGNEEWNKIFEGNGEKMGNSISLTDDGGYIITGFSRPNWSWGSDSDDVWLIKTDFDGNIDWEKTFSYEFSDRGNYIQKTIDGGYIITGRTSSNNLLLIKTDLDGNEEWYKSIGVYNSFIEGFSVEQTDDEGYIITGETEWNSNNLYQVLLLKTDSNGNTTPESEWE